MTRKVTSTNTVAYSGGCEEPQNDGGEDTAVYPESAGSTGSAGTGHFNGEHTQMRCVFYTRSDVLFFLAAGFVHF